MRDSGGLLDTGSELIPKNPKCHWSKMSKPKTSTSEVDPQMSGDEWSLSSHPSHSGPSGSLNPSYGYFPSSGMHNWNRYYELPEYPHWLPGPWSESYNGGKGQVEATRTVSTWENNKPKEIPYYRRDCRD